MSKFPEIEAEKQALKNFVEIAASKKDSSLVKKAERFLVKLESPVRVGIVGAKDSDKLALTRLLSGHELVPPSIGDTTIPAVIVLHAKKPVLAAGWWNGRRQNFAIEGIRTILAERPDYLEFAYPLPVLEQVSFFKMPAPKDFQDQERRMAWILKRADMILWCKVAGEPWESDDRSAWKQASEAIQANSMMIATGMNRLDKEAGEKFLERLKKTTQGTFGSILPISTVEAMVAAPKGVVIDADLWSSSGGKNLVSSLIKQASSVKENIVADVRAFLTEQGVEIPEIVETQRVKSKRIKSAIPEELGAEQPKVITPGKPKTARQLSKAVSGADLRARVAAMINQLSGLSAEESNLNLSEFIDTSIVAATEVNAMMEGQDYIDPSAAWLADEIKTFQACLEAVKNDPTKEDARDTALILLQIARDISWSVAA